jgi:PAS domain S-box-containing protein
LNQSLVLEYINQAAEKILGVEREDVIHQPLLESFPEAKGSDFEKYYRTALAQKIPINFESYFDPLKSWFNVNVYPFEDKISVFFQNITEKRTSIETLRKSEDRFRLLFDNIQVGALLLNQRGEIKKANHQAAWILGEELQYLQNTVFLRESSLINEYGQKIKQQDSPLNLALRLKERVHLDSLGVKDEETGSIQWLRITISPQLTQDGSLNLLIVTLEDVTERKRADETIKNANLRLSQLESFVNSSPDAIQVSDETGRMVFINQVASRRLGIKRQQATRYTVSDFEPLFRESKEWNEHVAELKKKKKLIIESVNVHQKHRSFFPVEVTVTFKNIEEKGYVIAISRDISERKKVEKEKQNLIHNLEETLKEKNILFKELHHRIKNNLQLVNSLMQIKAFQTDDQQLKEYIKETSSRILSIARIHNQLLNLQEVSRLNVKPYLEELARDLVNTYVGVASHHKLQLDIESQIMDIEYVLTLGLLVNEIVSNSFKHAFSPGQKGKISISLIKRGGWYTLTVKDNGKGISNEVLSQPGSSYGLQLIELFTSQIEGNYEIKNEKGTQYRITFRTSRHGI